MELFRDLGDHLVQPPLHGHSKGKTSWKPLRKSKRENYRKTTALEERIYSERAQSWEHDFHGVSI